MIEIDSFSLSLAQIRLNLSGSRSVVISFPGTSTWGVFFKGSSDGSALDDDNDGLEEALSEITDLNLVRHDSAIGDVSLHISPLHKSLGMIEELANNTAGQLDVPPFTATGLARSSFAVFVEIVIDENTFHTSAPFHLQSVISHKPPAPGTKYIDLFSSELELLDKSNQPTGNYMKIDYYIPNFILSTGNDCVLH